jgi:hypothetical protein
MAPRTRRARSGDAVPGLVERLDEPAVADPSQDLLFLCNKTPRFPWRLPEF